MKMVTNGQAPSNNAAIYYVSLIAKSAQEQQIDFSNLFRECFNGLRKD